MMRKTAWLLVMVERWTTMRIRSTTPMTLTSRNTATVIEAVMEKWWLVITTSVLVSGFTWHVQSLEYLLVRRTSGIVEIAGLRRSEVLVVLEDEVGGVKEAGGVAEVLRLSWYSVEEWKDSVGGRSTRMRKKTLFRAAVTFVASSLVCRLVF
jgi:hypothetical protein